MRMLSVSTEVDAMFDLKQRLSSRQSATGEWRSEMSFVHGIIALHPASTDLPVGLNAVANSLHGEPSCIFIVRAQ